MSAECPTCGLPPSTLLGMVATAYGIDAAERLRGDALAYGEMIAADPNAR